MTDVNGYFDSKRDSAIITAGGFFCHACIVGKPADDMSSDSRYCIQCFEYLTAEAGRLGVSRDTGKKPDWVPVDATQGSPEVTQGDSEARHKKADSTLVLPTLTQNSQSTEKRGRKPLDVATDKVLDLAAAGATNRAIAAELGISRETARRILAGQRTLVEA